ncbi:hypothetical protein ACF2JD_19305 [Aeromonas sp. A-5]|uniref:hypothetical protein n=1 Tax=Aeromonas ichthyocola TaxID=3367746 RepID=UPI0038E4E9CC
MAGSSSKTLDKPPLNIDLITRLDIDWVGYKQNKKPVSWDNEEGNHAKQCPV